MSTRTAVTRYSSENITKPLLTSAFSMLALSISAGINASPLTEDVYPLGQIMVKEEVETASHFRIDREQIERINARSLDEAIRLVPSLNVRNGADGTPVLIFVVSGHDKSNCWSTVFLSTRHLMANLIPL